MRKYKYRGKCKHKNDIWTLAAQILITTPEELKKVKND